VNAGTPLPLTGNPFSLPGLEANPHQPLRSPDHERFYVDVDRTGEAFREFETALGTGQVLPQGRLVVVAGPKGSGKTSLIRRCITALQKSPITADHTLVAADLSSIGTGNSRPTRLTLGTGMLLDILEVDADLEQRWMTSLRELQEEPQRLYAQLSRILERTAASDSLLLAVQLPASDERSEDEIAEYARFVSPRIVFFAESSHLHLEDGWRARIGGSTQVRPLPLEVGKLGKSDYVRFAESRLGRDDINPAPQIEEGTMVWLRDQHGLTLEQLQKLLHNVYERLRHMPHPPVVVTREVIDRCTAESVWVPEGRTP
jgi:RecA/RadA recombinase